VEKKSYSEVSVKKEDFETKTYFIKERGSYTRTNVYEEGVTYYEEKIETKDEIIEILYPVYTEGYDNYLVPILPKKLEGKKEDDIISIYGILCKDYDLENIYKNIYTIGEQ
jgi:hypothetical protein